MNIPPEKVVSDDAAILCLVCTAAAAGTELVATVKVTPRTTLSQVRDIIRSLAAGGTGGPHSLPPEASPVNVSEAQSAAWLEAPLYPFDFSEPKSHSSAETRDAAGTSSSSPSSSSRPRPAPPYAFTRCGVPVPTAEEESTAVADVFPRFPRFGPPPGARWQLRPDLETPSIAVRLPGRVPHTRLALSILHVAPLAALPEAPPAGEAGVAASSPAPCVALDRPLAERLAIQRQAGAYGRAPALASATPSWCSAVTRWNGNVADSFGRTVLHDAVLAGSEGAVRFLLAQPFIDTAAADTRGNTALHLAIAAPASSWNASRRHGRGGDSVNDANSISETIARMLLEATAADRLCDANHAGDTALHLALRCRRPALVGALCSRLRAAGVGLAELREQRNAAGQSPVTLFEDAFPSLWELCAGDDDGGGDDDDDGEGSLLAVRSLVSHYLFDPAHLQRRDGLLRQTVVHAAAASGNVAVLRFLLEDLAVMADWAGDAEEEEEEEDGGLLGRRNGGDDNEDDEDETNGRTPSEPVPKAWLDARGETPLHVAARRGRSGCCALLLDYFPPLLRRADHNGNTPLLAALCAGQRAAAETILARAAPGTAAHDARNNAGMTALHVASAARLVGVVESLLAVHGADPGIRAGAGGGEGSHSVAVEGGPAAGYAFTGPLAERRNRFLVRAGTRYPLPRERQPRRNRHHRENREALQQKRRAEREVYERAARSAAERCPYGGGLIDATPALCAVAAGSSSSSSSSVSAAVLHATEDTLRLLISYNGVTAPRDARAVMHFLLLNGMEVLLGQWVAAAPAVREAAMADNALLCGLCAAGCSAGIRWCVANRVCDVNVPHAPSGGAPLVCSAARGDAEAVRFLLRHGADPNERGGPGSALWAAVAAGHDAVAHALIAAGARVQAADGGATWSLLHLAAERGHTLVLRALLGAPGLDSADVALTLARVLQSMSRRAAGRTTLPLANPSAASFFSLAEPVAACDQPLPPRRVQAQMALHLAQHFDATASAVHPFDVLHLAASQRLFDVAHAIADRLAALPAATLADLRDCAPPPPARPTVTVRQTCDKSDVTAGRNPPPRRRGLLYHPPAPLQRLAPPPSHAAAAAGVMTHRYELRDAFSYAAQHRQVELVEKLRAEPLRLRPWPVADLRGWTAGDYALCSRQVGLTEFFVAVGVLPLRRHPQLGRVVGRTAFGILLEAVHHSVLRLCHHRRSRSSVSGEAGSGGSGGNDDDDESAETSKTEEEGEAQLQRRTQTAVLHTLIALLTRGAITPMLRLLDTYFAEWRWREAEMAAKSGAVASSATASVARSSVGGTGAAAADVERLSWLRPLLTAAARARRVDVIKTLHEEYRLPVARLCELAAPSTDHDVAWAPSPLLVAVHHGDTATAAYLVHQCRCSPTQRSRLSPLERLPRAAAAAARPKTPEQLLVTPLCLAAWRGDAAMLGLLTGSGLLRAETCVEAPDGGVLADALKALVVGTPHLRGAAADSRERLVADGVRRLALAGHPYLSPLVLRTAAARGMRQTVAALLECYGPAVLTADMAVADEITGVHHVVARRELCGLLTPHLSLVARDEFGAESRVRSGFCDQLRAAARVVPAPLALDDSRREGELVLGLVDYALQRDCAEGALLLLALGGRGRGTVQPTVTQRPLTAHVRAVLRHHAAVEEAYSRAAGLTSPDADDGTQSAPLPSKYTFLHSAVALGLSDVIEACIALAEDLPPLLGSPTNSNDDKSNDNSDQQQQQQREVVVSGQLPSLTMLAAFHADGAAWVPAFESGTVLPSFTAAIRLEARSFLPMLFRDWRITPALDAVCRHPGNRDVMGQMFPLFEDAATPAFTSTPASRAFLSELLHRDRGAVLVGRPFKSSSSGGSGSGGTGGLFVVSSVTPLSCAVLAGRVAWVQYLTQIGPSMAHHQAVLAACAPTPGDTAALTADVRRHNAAHVVQRLYRPPKSKGGRYKTKKTTTTTPSANATGARGGDTPHVLGHLFPKSSADATTTTTTVSLDVLCLSALLLLESSRATSVSAVPAKGGSPSARGSERYRRNEQRAAAQRSILSFLLTLPGVLRPANANLVALSLAVAAEWELLDALLEATLQSRDSVLRGRFLYPIAECDVPAPFRGLLGSARHALHAAAARGTAESILRLAARSTREDVETACDAAGRTAVYHAVCRRALISTTIATTTTTSITSGVEQASANHRAKTNDTATCALEALRQLRVPLDQPCCRRSGRTPLMVAAALGATPLVEALLKPNRVDARDRYGRTPLMHAAAHGHSGVAERLLAAGADAGAVDCLGSTAAAAAARHGHDMLAADLTKHFSRAADVAGPSATLLHAAAVGGCWRTAEAALALVADAASAVLQEDTDGGHTPLYLAHAFGSGRVLRTYMAALGSDPHAAAPLFRNPHLGAVEQRLVRCDPALPPYGWLRGVLNVNGVVVSEAARSGAAVFPRPGELVTGPAAPPLVRWPADRTLLQWCARANNAVGVRVLADLNVADADGSALHTAAANGFLDVVKLLVKLRMSNPDTPAPAGCPAVCPSAAGLYAFEAAAMAGHTACAAYLLERTTPSPHFFSAAAGTSGAAAHTTLHRLAPRCGGAVLEQLVRRMLAPGAVSAAQRPLFAAKLVQALGAPDSVGLTPFEYAIAMGDAASVLRTAQLLHQLQQDAGGGGNAVGGLPESPDATGAEAGGEPLSANAGTTTTTTTPTIAVSSALFQYLPNMSPAVRAVLFDVFDVERVAVSIGFSDDNDNNSDSSSSGGDQKNKKKQRSGAAADTTTARMQNRMRFADVRLVGIARLQADDYCFEQTQRVYTAEHERRVLRLLLRDFPYRIRYEPAAFRAASPARQTQLLQWLGSSLVLSAYELEAAGEEGKGADTNKDCTSTEIDSIEIRCVSRREEQMLDTRTPQIVHSLYVSASRRALVVPRVAASLQGAWEAARRSWQAELEHLCARATTALRSLPHPAMRRATVQLQLNTLTDWPREGQATLEEDAARWEPVRARLRRAVMAVVYTARHPLRDLLAGAIEEDLRAVVEAVRAAAPATVTLLWSAGPETPVRRYGPEDLATRRPTSQCTLSFNAAGDSCDALFLLRRTLCRSVAADVALVGIHYARDRFISDLSALLTIVGGDGAATHGANNAAGAAAQEGGDNDDNAAAAAAAVVPVSFKLELEHSALEDLPLAALEQMLSDARAAVAQLTLPLHPHSGRPAPSAHHRRFHSECIVADAVQRRLRSVLVLFTTRRDAGAKLSGDRLLLSFTPALAPNKAVIEAELRAAVVHEETKVARRLLIEVTATLTQKLQAYLPQARLVVDYDALQGNPSPPAGSVSRSSAATDAELLLSSLRLLAFRTSVLCMQPLVEGVCLGWSTELGARVRQHVQLVVLSLAPGVCGDCVYRAADRSVTYYCPLQCVQRREFGQSSWQLLSAHQVAALLLMQLAVFDRSVRRHVGSERSLPGWCVVTRAPRVVGVAERRTLGVRCRNLFAAPIRAGGETDFKLVSPFTDVAVSDRGDGRYRVRCVAPTVAGNYALYIFLRGQQVLQSPMRVRVTPGAVSLPRTTLVSAFDAVAVGRPFTLRLQLRDEYDNALSTTADSPVCVEVGARSAGAVELVSVAQTAGEVRVTLLVPKTAQDAVGPAMQLALRLSLPQDTAGAGSNLAGNDGGSSVVVVPLTVVSPQVYRAVRLLRQGHAPNETTNYTATLHARLYFRRTIRAADRRRLDAAWRAVAAQHGSTSASGATTSNNARTSSGGDGGALRNCVFPKSYLLEDRRRINERRQRQKYIKLKAKADERDQRYADRQLPAS